MDKWIKLEELGQFTLSILLFTFLDFKWWVFPALILLPDLSMLGYIHSPKTGALIYNIFHHKLTGVAAYAMGVALNEPVLSLAGAILFGHSAMDRIFGYGLKYPDSFHHTHLGTIGKSKADGTL